MLLLHTHAHWLLVAVVVTAQALFILYYTLEKNIRHPTFRSPTTTALPVFYLPHGLLTLPTTFFYPSHCLGCARRTAAAPRQPRVLRTTPHALHRAHASPATHLATAPAARRLPRTAPLLRLPAAPRLAPRHAVASRMPRRRRVSSAAMPRSATLILNDVPLAAVNVMTLGRYNCAASPHRNGDGRQRIRYLLCSLPTTYRVWTPHARAPLLLVLLTAGVIIAIIIITAAYHA